MAITKISSALIGANTIATANIADNAIDGTKIAQNSILTKHIDDAQITTGHIVDDAVTLAKMDGLARGKIIYGDASGNPAALALGSNGTVLKSEGTDIAWATDATVAALTSEEVQDIAGAMFSSNTETGITATYQDADGTIDLVVGTLNQDTTGTAATVTGAAQSAITSLGTLTTLTVDEITLNADTLTASDDFIIDAVGDITLDAADNQIFFKDNGTTVGTLSMTDSNLKIISGVSDKDIILAGSDGGSEVTALTLDMSDAGSATFNNDVTVSGNLIVTGTTTQTGSLVSNTNFQGLSQNNSANSTDFGFFGKYVESSTTKYAGLFFDASTDNTFRLYTDSQSAPSTTVNTGATGYAAANIVLAQVDNTQTNVSQSARVAQVAITSSSNAVAWDAKAAQNAYHVTTENTTFSAPSNAVEGAVIQVELAQGGTARTIAWNTVFEFAASTAPTVTATANKTDIFTFRYNGSVWQEIGRVQNMAQT